MTSLCIQIHSFCYENGLKSIMPEATVPVRPAFFYRLCIDLLWGIQIVEFHYFGFECNFILYLNPLS